MNHRPVSRPVILGASALIMGLNGGCRPVYFFTPAEFAYWLKWRTRPYTLHDFAWDWQNIGDRRSHDHN